MAERTMQEDFIEIYKEKMAREGIVAIKEECSRCVVFCKKVAPYVFDISKGVAVLEGPENSFNDGIRMIALSAKVVFIFKEDE